MIPKGKIPGFEREVGYLTSLASHHSNRIAIRKAQFIIVLFFLERQLAAKVPTNFIVYFSNAAAHHRRKLNYLLTQE
jgi:hypothetical protein